MVKRSSSELTLQCPSFPPSTVCVWCVCLRAALHLSGLEVEQEKRGAVVFPACKVAKLTENLHDER